MEQGPGGTRGPLLPTTTTPAPVVVFFHGGGWIGGSRAQVAQSLLREVPNGYAAASVDYRLAPTVQFPVPLEDAKTAVRWVKAHAAEYHLRADKVLAAGVSAGGHIAAMVARRPDSSSPPTSLPVARRRRLSGRWCGVGSRSAGPQRPGSRRRPGALGTYLVAKLLGCPAAFADQAVTCSEEQMSAGVTDQLRDPGRPTELPPSPTAPKTRSCPRPPTPSSWHGCSPDSAGAGTPALDEVENQGHNLDNDGLNVTRLHAYLDRVLGD